MRVNKPEAADRDAAHKANLAEGANGAMLPHQENRESVRVLPRSNSLSLPGGGERKRRDVSTQESWIMGQVLSD